MSAAIMEVTPAALCSWRAARNRAEAGGRDRAVRPRSGRCVRISDRYSWMYVKPGVSKAARGLLCSRTLAAEVLKYQRAIHGLSLADVAKKLGAASRKTTLHSSRVDASRHSVSTFSCSAR
jgi:hypothetical protein